MLAGGVEVYPKRGVYQYGSRDGYTDGTPSFAFLANSIQPFTFECWYMFSAAAARYPLLWALDGSTNYTGYNYGGATMGVGGNLGYTNGQAQAAAADVYSVGALKPKIGAFISCVHDQANARVLFYINGINVGVVTSPVYGGTDGNTWAMFGKSSAGGQFFNGEQAFCEVRLWNRIRTPAEIKAFWNKPITTKESSLLHYWKCDEKTGLVLYDSAGTTNLTLSGGVRVPLKPYESITKKLPFLVTPSIQQSLGVR